MEPVLEEQKRYYRERAPEYDDWWFRRGRYALEQAQAERWFADCAEAEAALDAFRPRGDVLELACGTGLWTRRLVRHAARVTAVDASAEVLALNRERVRGASVEYVQADVFEWEPERAYDVCFFGYWLSHVPESHFERFWGLVRAALRVGGRVFFVDSARWEGSVANVALADGEEIRRLADGREFRVVKHFYAPQELERRLAQLGWAFSVRRTENGSILYGSGS